jgi:hypothetical protein
MDSLINLFDKLNTQLKYQLLMIITGLVMPSLIYLTLNFPAEIYNLDLFKLIVLGSTYNFTIIAFVSSFSIIINNLVLKKYTQTVYNAYNQLSTNISDTKRRVAQFGEIIQIPDETIPIEKSIKYKEEHIKLTSDIEHIEKENIKLSGYLYSNFSVIRIISDSSAITTLYMIYISVFNSIIGYDLDFDAISVFDNIFPYMIIFPIVYSLANYLNRKNKHKEINRMLKSRIS